MRDVIVSVVIANWNGKRYLATCLSSLKNQTFPSFEIVMVDNGSFDGSVDFVKKNFPEVRLIRNKINLGFAQANNIGILASKGAYIATLNNDTWAEPGWIENLINAAERRKDAGMFASKILSYTKRTQIESCGMLIYPDGIAKCRGYCKKDTPLYDREEEILLPSACAALYRKDALLRAGLFDADYFAYCEDTDIGLRIRLLGLQCLYVPSARVYHHYSGTSRQDILLKVYFAERNRLWTAIKIFPIQELIRSPLYTFKRYVSYISGAVFRTNHAEEFFKGGSSLKIINVVCRAYLSTLLHLIPLLIKRRRIMRHKKTRDKEVTAWLRKYIVDLKELTLHEKFQ